MREALQAYVWRSRGISCDLDQIIIVNGSQQALDLCARVLVNPGDRVVVEDPCYAMAKNVMLAVGANTIAVPCGAHGMDTTKLPEAGDIAVAYVTPSHQFPLGGVLPAAHRQALMEWAASANAYVIEDDYDSEYRYDVGPIPPLYLSGQGPRHLCRHTPSGQFSLMAGLLARGSQRHPAVPAFRPVAFRIFLAAYSCGGSHGLGPLGRTMFPFHPGTFEPGNHRAATYCDRRIDAIAMLGNFPDP